MYLQLPLPAVRNRPRYHWFVVATVCVGAFMAALDSSIVNIAMPVMKRSFDTHMRVVEWVSLSYILTLAALIVPFSRLSDMYGRRGMYSAGFSVFLVGSFFCGVAPTFPTLLAARVMQAAGAAMLQANSVSIITATTPARDRGKAIGVQASAQGVGLSLGPVVGGALISLLGWRWIFYVNVPVGILGTLAGVLLLPRSPSSLERDRFDWAGSILLAPTLVALIYLLNQGAQMGWMSTAVLVSLGVTVVGFLGFLVTEQRVHAPMVDFALFRSRTFSVGNLTVVLSFAVMYAVMFLAPFYLDNVRKLDAMTSGLFLMVIPVGMTLLTPVSGVIADRLQAKLPTIGGMVMAAAGCLILVMAIPRHAPLWFLTGLFLVGCGMGLFTPANNSHIMGSVPKRRLGISGGVLNMSRTLGMGLGVTLGGLTYQLYLRANGVVVENLATPHQMLVSFRDAFGTVGLLAVLVAVLAAWMDAGDDASHEDA
ncbi:MAG: MFS transporter [Alicyclobacillus sp.]|nr:MFS transporter [Alicyclobacillus sp.]